MKRAVKSVAAMMMFAAMAAEGGRLPYSNEGDFEDSHAKPKKNFIPKGCEFYHFDKDGNWTTHESAPPGTVYSCIARSEKNAIKKYGRFIK